ncbi:MAG: hypothetical protein H7Z75_07020 [Ferruginibacter sp.]|nr:hypothetical protein [Cytophagales bacterium]
MPLPVNPDAELNALCFKVAKDVQFRGRMYYMGVLTRTVSSAHHYLPADRWQTIMELAGHLENEPVSEQSEVQAEALIQEMGFRDAFEVQHMVSTIVEEDAILAGRFPLMQRYGVNRVYEQASRYLYNRHYRLPDDRQNGETLLNGTEEDEDKDPRDNPNTPFWNEEFGTWTNPAV